MVLRRHQPLDLALERHTGLPRLADRDRAFARTLTATTLRRLGQIDALIEGCLSRPLPNKAAPVIDVLRLGACQLVFLHTPAHAAVDTAVELVRRRRWAGYAALVNGILRRLAREGAAMAEGQDAAYLNTPGWLWERWTSAYGAAVCRRIAEAHMEEPPLDLTPKADAEATAATLGGSLLPSGSVRIPLGGPVSALPGYDNGDWWVQDAAAALPAALLGPMHGRRVVDLCAAPGGKTAQLAAAGASVIAVDRSAERLARVEANLQRLGLLADLVVADAGDWRPEEPADAVLLDAPCSATGTIRRHPDVPWLKQPQDIAAMQREQARLLDAAVAMVRPGGIVIYCVCSLEPEEGPDVIAARLAADSAVRRRPVDAAEVGGLEELLTTDGDLRTLPCHLAAEGGIDGFYAARLERCGSLRG